MEMTTRRGFIGGMTAAVALAEWKAWAAEEGLPEYYAGHLAAVTEKVRALARECGDGFWFVTDPHVKSNHCKSGRIIAELIRRTGLRRVLCGGDHFVRAACGNANVFRVVFFKNAGFVSKAFIGIDIDDFCHA